MDGTEQYWKLSETEQRFNDTQTGIRSLASAWLLAAVGAIGFLLQEPSKAWSVPLPLLGILVATLASSGFATLWVLDQLVFQRLLNAVFVVGLRLEHIDPTLPPIRAMMMKSAEGKGMHRWLKLFYVVPMIAFICLSGLLLIEAGQGAILRQESLTGIYLGWGKVLMLVQVSVLAWLLWRSDSISFEKRAGMFGNDNFTEMVRNDKYELVIASYRGFTGSATKSG